MAEKTMQFPKDTFKSDLSAEERRHFISRLEEMSPKMAATLYVNGTGGWAESAFAGARGFVNTIKLALTQ